MTRDAGPAPTVEAEALLTAREAGALVHKSRSRWFTLAASNPILRAGRVSQDGRTYWLRSSVTAYIRSLRRTTRAGRAA